MQGLGEGIVVKGGGGGAVVVMGGGGQAEITEGNGLQIAELERSREEPLGGGGRGGGLRRSRHSSCWTSTNGGWTWSFEMSFELELGCWSSFGDID